MSDNFALLNEPHHPWIDPDLLKAKFLALAAEVHPDRVHQASPQVRDTANRRYSELNAAYHCLRDPKERVRHLLELESGAKPAEIQSVPPEIMDGHFAIASLCREADAFLAESARAASPILKVQFFSRAGEWTDKLTALRQKIESRREELSGELRAMNPAWDAALLNATLRAQLPLSRLDAIYRLLGYISRWLEQLQVRLLQMSLVNL